MKFNHTRKKRGGTIIKSHPTEFDLQKANELDNYIIYRITINNCYYYFHNFNTSGKNNDYLLVLINSNYHIFKFNESIRDLDEQELNEVDDIIKENTNKLMKRMKLERKNILLFIPTTCRKYIDLTNAKKTLNQLNAELTNVPGNLSLHIDYIYNLRPPNNKVTAYSLLPDKLILCLFNNEGCISSIIIDVDDKDDTIYISSKTDKHYENKSYNKLLRSVIIILSRTISERNLSIVSYAINPISAYLSIQYFGAFISDDTANYPFFNYLRKNGIILDSQTNYKKLLNDYKKYILENNDYDFGMTLILPTDDVYIENAYRIFYQTLSGMRG